MKLWHFRWAPLFSVYVVVKLSKNIPGIKVTIIQVSQRIVGKISNLSDSDEFELENSKPSYEGSEPSMGPMPH